MLYVFLVVQAKKKPMITSKSLDHLIKGNERYVNNKSEHPNRKAERSKELQNKPLSQSS